MAISPELTVFQKQLNFKFKFIFSFKLGQVRLGKDRLGKVRLGYTST